MTWPSATLADVAEWGSGGTPPRSVGEYFGEGMPWLSIADLNDGVVSSAKESLTLVGIQSSAAKVVPAGTVFVAMYGSIGKLGISDREMCTSQALAFAVPNPDVISTPYLFHYLLSQRRNLLAAGRGGTQKNISQGDLKNWPIPLPPLAEQRRLAAILDKLESLRTKRRQSIETLDQLAQAEFHSMFGDPIANGRRCEVLPLIDLVDKSRPISYGILMPGPHQVAGVKYVRVVDLKDGSVDPNSVRQTTREISDSFRRSLLEPGDLLMSIRGHVGRLALVPDVLKGANITQDTARIAIQGVSAIYVRECLRMPAFRRWMDRHTKGVAVRGINLGDVKQMPIPVPPKVLQDEFASKVLQIESIRSQTRRHVAELDALFASLQQRAFAGELV